MRVIYKLKVINNNDVRIIKSGSLKEIDEFTSNFNNEEELLAAYNVKKIPSGGNKIAVTYDVKTDSGVKPYSVNGIVYKNDVIVFDTPKLLRLFYTYQSPIEKENITFIRLLADTYSDIEYYRNLCINMKANLNTDYSNQYFEFLRRAKESYSVLRNLYFMRKQIDALSMNNNIGNKQEEYYQMDMFDYIEKPKTR